MFICFSYAATAAAALQKSSYENERAKNGAD